MLLIKDFTYCYDYKAKIKYFRTATIKGKGKTIYKFLNNTIISKNDIRHTKTGPETKRES